LYEAMRRPGTGSISDAVEVHASPDGRHAVFAGALMDKLEGVPTTRICQVDLATGGTRVLTFGPNTDRLPKYSPDGRHIAFLSDRQKAGHFQLYVLDSASGLVRPTSPAPGWVEYLQWSPDGARVLLGVAGHGADVAGSQGAVTSEQLAVILSWMPAVDTVDKAYRWRSAWAYELESDRAERLSPADCNVWEATWCGNQAVAVIASSGPGEGLWYSATLRLLDIRTRSSWEVYTPRDQIGWPAASPSGRHVAIVEGICSDRYLVAGDVQLIETTTGKTQRLDTKDIDVTHAEWRSDRQLLLGGQRAFETVLGLYDVLADTFTEVWRSEDITTGGRYFTASGINQSGDCVLVGETFLRAPEIAVIRQGEYRRLKSFDSGYSNYAQAIAAVEHVRWNAKDGLEIHGWLLKPHGTSPHPVVMCVHGGPVWQWRPQWLGRASAAVLMLLKRGYAMFYPNPRGSSGRGRQFAREVVGDMGGADTYDYLSGLDHLVAHGIADPKRLGVTGVSYGGFMTSWLITQDARFAAAVPVAPITNYVSEHLLSNIPQWPSMFLEDCYNNPTGKYFERSPIMHAHKARTPTLNICGALDRSAPPEEAKQFHNALLENGIQSVLATYPHEGHGIRKFPAMIDYAARVVAWFEEHLVM
jgi:dipeptidyl aminopeptidase/acylaminoacyl peptidase